MGRRSRARGRFGALELLDNGDFSKGLEGWDIRRAEAVAVVDGWMEISQTTEEYSYVQKIVDVSPGKLYEFEVAVRQHPTENARPSVQIYDGLADLIATVKEETSGEVVLFRAVQDRVRIMARLNVSSGFGYFQNFHLREV